MKNNSFDQFFHSLPSEKEAEPFDLKKELGQKHPQEAKPEKAEEEEAPKAVSEEPETPKRPNRRERRGEQNRFWEEQLKHERERAERLETELLRRAQDGESKKEVDARLMRLFGDTAQGIEASRIVSELLKETEERATAPYRTLEEERKQEVEAQSRFEEDISNGIADVEDAYGIDLSSRSASKIRSDFLDFVEDLSPGDSFVNFEKAWPLFQANQKAPKDPETVQRKKEIASRSLTHSGTARPEIQAQPVTFDSWDRIKARLLGK